MKSSLFSVGSLSGFFTALGACALAFSGLTSNARGALVTYSTQITASDLGYIESDEIAVGDLFNIRFTADGAAESYDDGGILIWELNDAIRDFTMTRDAGNSGTWDPGVFGISFAKVTMQNTTLAIRLDLTGGNMVSFDPPSGANTAGVRLILMDFVASGSISDGDPLSKFLSPTMAGTGSTVEFLSLDNVGTNLGAALSPATAVPEPSGWILLGLGLGALVVVRGRLGRGVGTVMPRNSRPLVK